MNHFRFAVYLLLTVALPFLSTPGLAQRSSTDTIKSIRAKPKNPTKPAAAAKKRRKPAPVRTRPVRSTIRATVRHVTPLATPVTAKPRPAPPATRTIATHGLIWTVKPGVNKLTMEGDEIHVAQTAPRDTLDYASATARLGMGSTPLWRISFDVRFRDLRSTGSCIKLASGDRLVGIVGADGTTSNMTAVVATSNWPKYARRADGEWAQCEFLGTKSGMAAFVNGVKVGEGGIDGAPDTLTLGPMSAQPGQQTEMAVRELSVASASDPVHPIELFNGKNLAGWAPGPQPWTVQDGVLKSLGGGQFDWLKFEAPISAHAFTLTLRVRIVDGIRFRFFITHGPTLLAHLAGTLVEFFSADGNSRTVKLIGTSLANIKSTGKSGYQTGQWHEVRYEVDRDGYAALFLDDNLISSAIRTREEPLAVALCPSDNFSQGHIEVTSVQLSVSD